MVSPPHADFEHVVRAAVELDGIESAVVFVLRSGASDLALAAAAGIDGPPLDRLSDAVRNPAHPIARTITDGRASFDVLPTAPGGPTLRSHLPIGVDRGAAHGAVLAVAHDQPLGPETRQLLERLATLAGSRPGDEGP